MDMEKLNKSQIILLTLLVSFVTSIATGIVTVSLMEQAPPVIPQTINRIVERTVERVVPHETQTATVITREKTVVVKESDMVAQAVARVRPSLVKFYTRGTEADPGVFLARGIVIAKGYAIGAIPDAKVDAVYAVALADHTITARVVSLNVKQGLALLELNEPTTSPALPASVLGTDPLTLGQTIIALTGTSNSKVLTGIVTEVHEDDKAGSLQTSFEADIVTAAFVDGSPVVNTDGAIIGMFVGTDKLVTVALLKNLVSSLNADSSEKKATSTPLI
ncbi:MAG: serine protease [Patescibacteria group bacterium]